MSLEKGKKDNQVKFDGNGDNQSPSIDFSFDAEYSEFEGYMTLAGHEQTDVHNMTGYGMVDLEIGDIVSGRPEITIFENNDKKDNGEYVRKYQSLRVRVIDGDEYVDLYANIPRRDENGFIENLTKFSNFYRTGFDLVFSFMRFLDENNVITPDGEEINRIKKVNIEAIGKFIDNMEYCRIKIIAGADENYDSFIIIDLKETI